MRDKANKARITKAWALAHPDRQADLQRAWNRTHPEKNSKRLRRVLAKGLTIRRIEADHCLVPGCGLPLVSGATYPDPMATTHGHEPPISRCRELGVTVVIERPEHWGCNLAKGTHLDSELVSAAI